MKNSTTEYLRTELLFARKICIKLRRWVSARGLNCLLWSGSLLVVGCFASVDLRRQMIWPVHNLKWIRQIVWAIRDAERKGRDEDGGNPEVREFSERASLARFMKLLAVRCLFHQVRHRFCRVTRYGRYERRVNKQSRTSNNISNGFLVRKFWRKLITM